MAEAKAIRERHTGETDKVNGSFRINQVVTGVPFGDGTVESYLDTSSGDVVMDLGRLENADVTVTTDYPDADILIVLHRSGFRLREIPVQMRPSVRQSMHSGHRSFYYAYKMVLSIFVTLLRPRARESP